VKAKGRLVEIVRHRSNVSHASYVVHRSTWPALIQGSAFSLELATEAELPDC
jgi:hypothetical protein